MPLQATSGAASYDAFGGGVAAVPNYIEECFSAFLYTGNGDTQTITNGIDLSTKGGLVWAKARPRAGDNHEWRDTVRGGNSRIFSNNTNAASSTPNPYTYNVDGYTIGGDGGNTNENGITYASWTFRKQPKFFDVVTYTGNGTTQNIAHSLGSEPGCVIVKETSGAGNDWQVYHRATTNVCGRLRLNLTNAETTTGITATWGNNTSAVPPTSTVFTVGSSGAVNASGATYVAYLFAHNAGGFGLTGTDNVISCGSFTTNGSGIIPTVDLGYEPQWVLAKPSSGTGNWFIMDNMRGWYNQQADQGNALFPNTSGAEAAGYNAMIPTATGFTGPSVNFGAGITYIYIAIRRGPMKVPTSGTSVFAPVAYAGTGSAATTTTGFVTDLAIIKSRGTYSPSFEDRLRGANKVLESSGTGAEVTTTQYVLGFDTQSGVRIGNDAGVNASGTNYIDWAFRRAPSFFDEVCYTGTGSALNVTHNLSAVPSFLIVKRRNTTGGWIALHQEGYAGSWGFRRLDNDTSFLNAVSYPTYFGDGSSFVAPTSTQFTVGSNADLNASGGTYVAYLFATCAGVSKVGSYTGTGATQTISCGFTGGARFVLIKRTDSTGNWYVWDTARGMVSGTDPYLLLNSTAAEVNTNSVYTTTDGFQIISTASGINASGGSFIFFAVA